MIPHSINTYESGEARWPTTMQIPEPTSQEQKARLLLGACRFEGMFNCPCREGSVFESLKDLAQHMPNIPCQKCGHSLILHDGHNGSSTSTEPESPNLKTEPHIDVRQGISTPSNDFIDNLLASTLLPVGDAAKIPADLCNRESTVRKIAQMLMDGGSVLIWGAKGTGKTTLAKFLYEVLMSENWKAILIPSWPDATKKKVEEVLLGHARNTFPELINEGLLAKDLIFIIDEAQESLKTLRARSAWSSLIKASQSSDVRPRFCIFSNQGIVAEKQSVFASMPEISYPHLYGSDDDDQLSLFLSTAEFEEYFQRNCGLLGYDLDQEAACHVYCFTAGHPTILKLIMHYIKLVSHVLSLLKPRILYGDLNRASTPVSHQGPPFLGRTSRLFCTMKISCSTILARMCILKHLRDKANLPSRSSRNCLTHQRKR